MTWLETRRRERDTLLARLLSLLEDDARVAAAWLTGSLGRGTEDALSDLDVWVVLTEAEHRAVLDDLPAFVERFSPLLAVLHAPQNAPPQGGYLLTMYSAPTGPQQVDWYFLPQSSAVVPTKVRLLFDRVGLPPEAAGAKTEPPTNRDAADLTNRVAFFWVMLLITAKYIVRGEEWRVLALLTYPARALAEVEALLKPALPMPDYRFVPAGSPPHTPAESLALLQTWCANMASLHSHLRAAGADISLSLADDAAQFLSHIARSI